MTSDRPGTVAIRRRSSGTGTANTSPGLGHPGRQVDPLAGEEVELAEEPAGGVRGQHLFDAVEGADDVDGAGQHDEEVVGGITLGVQHVAGLDPPPAAEPGEDAQLLVVEYRRGRVFAHGGDDTDCQRPVDEKCW